MASSVARRVVEGTEATLDALAGKLATGLRVSKEPPFIQRRLEYFERLYEREQEKNRGKC